MAAGPWFTVRTNQSDWQAMDAIWISNGATDDKAVVEYRSILEEPILAPPPLTPYADVPAATVTAEQRGTP